MREFKTYSFESADFMLDTHEFRGEPITAIYELHGKLLVFTPNHTYTLKRRNWLERLWAKIRRQP